MSPIPVDVFLSRIYHLSTQQESWFYSSCYFNQWRVLRFGQLLFFMNRQLQKKFEERKRKKRLARRISFVIQYPEVYSVSPYQLFWNRINFIPFLHTTKIHWYNPHLWSRALIVSDNWYIVEDIEQAKTFASSWYYLLVVVVEVIDVVDVLDVVDVVDEA